MKRILQILMMASLILSVGCKKDCKLTPATITGEDYRTCMCCGGYYVQIGNRTVRASEVIDNDVIGSQASFPIKVCIDTAQNYIFCGGWDKSVIKITQIKKR